MATKAGGQTAKRSSGRSTGRSSGASTGGRTGGARTASGDPGRRVATPWGPAALVEEVRVVQHAGERRFASLIQLLETGTGERLVRFAYTTRGVARRGPVTLRARDLQRLRSALGDRPELADALGWPGGDA